MFVLVYSFILSKPGQTLQPGHHRDRRQNSGTVPAKPGRLATMCVAVDQHAIPQMVLACVHLEAGMYATSCLYHILELWSLVLRRSTAYNDCDITCVHALFNVICVSKTHVRSSGSHITFIHSVC